MATRKFLTSVADVYAYDNSDNILFVAKTLLDSSIETSLGSAPVRGGRGNQLLYIYYHTGEMKFTLTDTQWNLALLGATTGADVVTGDDIFAEETVELTGVGTGTIVGTPKAFSGATIYGWGTDTAGDGTTYKLTFTGKNFTGAGSLAAGTRVCVRYYTNNAGVSSITIPANMIPKVVRLVMETQLNSADVSTNKIGVVQIIAPSVTLSGAFTISMKADGVANTPLTGSALAYNGPAGTDACAAEPYYARIIEIIDNANWYDNVVALAIEGGDFTLNSGQSKQLSVWAIPSSGASFLAPVADLTFASGTPTYYSVGANTGLVSFVLTGGSSVISVYITSKPAIEASANVTESAGSSTSPSTSPSVSPSASLSPSVSPSV